MSWVQILPRVAKRVVLRAFELLGLRLPSQLHCVPALSGVPNREENFESIRAFL